MVQAVTRNNDNPNDIRNREVVHAATTPEVGNLATPINFSHFTRVFINNLPAYREGLSPLRRGLEVGLTHGFWLVGPFAWLGPLRDTDSANLAGLLSAIGLVVISTLAISLYGASNPPNPTRTITTPHPPEALNTGEGWNEYAGGFFIGATGSAVFAYIILSNFAALRGLLSF